jgi:DNA-binding transcriptional regulator YiaG
MSSDKSVMGLAEASAQPDRDRSSTSLIAGTEIEIAGRKYVTTERLAAVLRVSTRTLGRWDAARVGPPRIKINKLVLYDLEKLPDWLASREIGPVRPAGRRGARP